MNNAEAIPQHSLFFQEYAKLLKDKKKCAAIWLLALFFACSCSLSSYPQHGLVTVAVVSLLVSIPLALLVGALLVILNTLRSGETKGLLGFSGRTFLITLAAMVLLWGIFVFLPCYPGVSTNDTEDILKMLWGMPFESDSFRYDTLNNHHPAFYVFLVWLPLQLGALLGLTQPVSVGLVSLLHMVTLAACCSLVQSKVWVVTKSRVFCALTFAFFALNPLVMLYSVTLWKDIVFAGVFIVYLVELFVLVAAGKRFFSSRVDVIALAVSALLCLLLRNNALVVIVPVALVLLVVLRKAAKQVALLFGSVVVAAALIVGPVYGALGVKPGHFVESVSIPLQQMSAVAASEDARITEAQREYLGELLPFDQYAQAYVPGHVNFIKFAPNFSDEVLEGDKLRFFVNWFELGLQNPSIYLTAWIDQTKAFWDPAVGTWYTDVPGYDINGEGNVSRNLTGGMLAYENLAALLDAVRTAFAPLYCSALLVWVVAFAFVAALLRKPKKMCLCLLPLLLWWLTYLVAAPADDFRYMFPIHLALPLVALVLLYEPADQKPAKRESA